MKHKNLLIVLCILGIFGTSACGKSSSNTSQTVIEQTTTDSEPESKDEVGDDTIQTVLTEKDGSEEKPNETVEEDSQDVDVDLSSMSGNMVYAEVYQMMSSPEDYLEKTIKVKGTFQTSVNDQIGKTYFFAVISDATACCAQGLEFVWDNGSHAYPDEYPEEGTEIELTGVFEGYMDPGDTQEYFRLLTDDVHIVS